MYYVLSLSPLTVLSTSFFLACYPFVGALVVCSFVYTCVYSCVPTCTLLYTRVYTEAFITTSFRGSLLLYGSALVYSANGLSSARQKGSCQLGGWTPLSSTEGLVPARRMDTSQLCGRARANTMDSLFSSPWRAPLAIVTAPL